jgi:phosphate transport system substrate-binding protein
MSLRKLIALAALAVLAFAGSGRAQGNILINGAGSTMAYPIYSKWFYEYHKLHPNIEINYASIGSGGGIQQLLSHTVDFGASDAPMSDQQLAQAGFKILHFPTVIGSAVPTYNLPGVTAALRFTPEALAGIYLGKITKWNDPAIAGQNPGVRLPKADLVVVHRSDGSGTTYCWTDYLSKVSPEWRSRVGRNTSVNWPVGLGGKGNEGVAGLVKQIPHSIGYVDVIYAIQNHLPYGSVKNSAGVFVKATLESLTKAAASVPMPADFRVSITDPPAKARDAFPIATFTWLLVPEHIADPTRRAIIKQLLRWALTDGQQYAGPLVYARLPRAVAQKEIQQISLIQ